MISIIICSRFQSISKELKDNIENTVGVVHEIICIDNSKSQYDIFSAYNEGVKRSQYPLLCFMHEDILPNRLVTEAFFYHSSIAINIASLRIYNND